jgi:hypothetical protein
MTDPGFPPEANMGTPEENKDLGKTKTQLPL